MVGEDIFKIYVKLRRDLGYKVSSIYSTSDHNLSQSDKDKILRDLETSYYIHLGSKNEKQSKKQEEIV